MNKTAIEWTDYTWNPVTGCWGPGGTAEKPNRCPYCYAGPLSNRFWERFRPPVDHPEIWALMDPFEPHFHRDRLSEPAKVKKPSRIFVCSMADLFGDWVPDEWIIKVFFQIVQNPQHTYQFLTKNPKRLKDFNPWPANCWVGTTVTNQADTERMKWFWLVDSPNRFVSHEPLLGLIDVQYPKEVFQEGPPMCCDGYECGCMGQPVDPPLWWGIKWAIIGAMTGPGAVKPKPE